MKTIIALSSAILIALCSVGCQNSSDRNSTDEQTTQQSDSTEMKGQPTSDEDRGNVTETEGAPEGAYGTGTHSESEDTK